MISQRMVRSFVVSLGVASVLIVVSLVIGYIGYFVDMRIWGAIPDILEQIADKTLFVQVMIWIALIPGNGYIFFMRNFTSFFGGKPPVIVKETDADGTKSTATTVDGSVSQGKKISWYVVLNISLIIFALYLFILGWLF